MSESNDSDDGPWGDEWENMPWDMDDDLEEDDAPDEGISPHECDIGDLVRLWTTFADVAGLVMDPAAITCTVTTPSGRVITYTYGVDVELVRESVGRYQLDCLPTISGIHFYEFGGNDIASERGVFIVHGDGCKEKNKKESKCDVSSMDVV